MEKVAAPHLSRSPALATRCCVRFCRPTPTRCVASFTRLTRDDIYSRFFSGMPRLPERHLRKLLATDLEHDLALLQSCINLPAMCSASCVWVEPRRARRSRSRSAPDLKHHGIGRLLMAEACGVGARARRALKCTPRSSPSNRASLGLAREVRLRVQPRRRPIPISCTQPYASTRALRCQHPAVQVYATSASKQHNRDRGLAQAKNPPAPSASGAHPRCRHDQSRPAPRRTGSRPRSCPTATSVPSRSARAGLSAAASPRRLYQCPTIAPDRQRHQESPTSGR